MKLFKTVLISLFLAYPFLSVAKTLIACTTTIDQYINTGLCLPNSPTGQFTNKASEWSSKFIFGFGDGFADAWNDAEDSCRKMVTTVMGVNGSFKQSPVSGSVLYCNLQECEDINPKKGKSLGEKILHAKCFCHRHLKEGKTCVKTNEIEVSSSTNMSGLYQTGLDFCQRVAIEQNDSLTVYCMFK